MWKRRLEQFVLSLSHTISRYTMSHFDLELSFILIQDHFKPEIFKDIKDCRNI